MSQDELFQLPVTVDLATAGRAFGLGPTTSRKMASEGEFPCRVLRLGHKYRVNRAEILRGLGYEVPTVGQLNDVAFCAGSADPSGPQASPG